MLRGIKSEADIILNGTMYSVGGLNQNTSFLAYCNRSELPDQLIVIPNSFHFGTLNTSPTQAKMSS